MILIVNSSFSTGGKVFTTPGFTFSGLSFFASIFADFELSGFFFTDAFLFNGSSTGGATDFGALLLFLRANLTWTLHIPTCKIICYQKRKAKVVLTLHVHGSSFRGSIDFGFGFIGGGART